MSKRTWTVVAGVCALALVAVVPGKAQNAKGWKPANQLIKSVHSSVSGPVRNMPKAKGKISPPREQPNPRRGRPNATQQATTLAPLDTDLQAPSGALDTVSGLDFEGIDFTGFYPPDTNLAVGNNTTGDGQVVETVNTEFAVFDKATGQLEKGPVNISTLFANSGTACGQTANGTDPIVLFDQISDRWIISVTADPPSNSRTNLMCLAVSETSDATGSYYAYEINFGRDFPDYPKLSVWPDGYYYTADMFFGNSSKYLGAAACVFNRSDFDGNATTLRSQCFQGSTSDYRLLPANLDGSMQSPAGSPGIFMELGSDNSSLLLYKLYAPWTNSGATSFPLAATIPVASFTFACGNGGTCIPQQGTSNTVDSLGDGLMYPLEYHNFGSYDSLVVNQSVNTGLAAGNVGIRWYEIHNLYVSDGVHAPYYVYEESTYTGADQTQGNPAYYRWMGSIAEDQVGDLALGYSKSSSSIYPGITYTGQSATSGVKNEMADENDAFGGSGSETSASRWGDYSSMAVDPGDDCTFWYANQYFPSNGISWNTRLLSFNFPDCPTFSLSSQNPSQTAAAGSATYTIDVTGYGATSQTVDFSPAAVYGLPSGASASFSSTSVTGSGSVTMGITTSGVASGTYPFYVVGTAGNAQKSVALTLIVGSGGGGGGGSASFTVMATPLSQSISPGQNPTYSVTVTSNNGFSGSVSLSVSGLPKFANGSFSVNPVSVSSGGQATSILTLRTNKNIAPSTGNGYPLVITGTSSGVQPSTYTVYLIVN